MNQKFFTLTVLLFSAVASAQMRPDGGGVQPMAGPVNPPGEFNTVSFEYDAAGNQKLRKFIYLPLAAPRHAADGPDENTATKEFTESEYPEISYYPNPVRSELSLRWSNTDWKQIKTFELYNLNSVLLSRFPNQDSNQELVIAFGSYPSGMYSLLLTYTNGEQKTLKIIKE